MKTKKWFSLVEILIWITIMWIMWSVVFPIVSQYQDKAELAAKATIIKTISDSLSKSIEEGWAIPQPVWADWKNIDYWTIWYLPWRWVVSQLVRDLKLNDEWIVITNWSLFNWDTKVYYATDAWQKFFAVGLSYKDPDTKETRFLVNTNFPTAKTDATLFWIKNKQVAIPQIWKAVSNLWFASANTFTKTFSLYLSRMKPDWTMNWVSYTEVLNSLNVIWPNNETVTFTWWVVFWSWVIAIWFTWDVVSWTRVQNKDWQILLDYPITIWSTTEWWTLVASIGWSLLPTCSQSSVTNWTVSSYPACSITCNSWYKISWNSCVLDITPTNITNMTITWTWLVLWPYTWNNATWFPAVTSNYWTTIYTIPDARYVGKTFKALTMQSYDFTLTFSWTVDWSTKNNNLICDISLPNGYYNWTTSDFWCITSTLKINWTAKNSNQMTVLSYGTTWTTSYITFRYLGWNAKADQWQTNDPRVIDIQLKSLTWVAARYQILINNM